MYYPGQNKNFLYNNDTPIDTILQEAEIEFAGLLKKSHYDIFEKHWIENCHDLRLIIQENELRSLDLPLRLCTYLEKKMLEIVIVDSKISDNQKISPASSPSSFTFTFDFDTNGVIYYIATAGGLNPWKNPMENGLIIVESSGLYKDSQPASAVVGRSTVRCVTINMNQAWFIIDLKEHNVCPNYYTLRHYSSWDNECLRNWRLDGSSDGVFWTTLRIHENDTSLNGRGATASWSLAKQSNYYNKFRILQTGFNSNKHQYLALSGFEIYGDYFRQAYNQNSNIMEFKYSYDFDHNGVIYYLGSEKNTKAYENPHNTHHVIVTSSSLARDSQKAPSILNFQTIRCVTENKAESWFCIQLCYTRLCPSHYSLRHYSSWDVEALRNWRLEGSNDGTNWTVLRHHVNDKSLAKRGATKTWTLNCDSSQFFSYFRIIQTGFNSNSHHYLALSGFEIYGTVDKMDGVLLKPSLENESKGQGRSFFYHHDFDSNGILYYLGTRGNTNPWTNPMDLGQVTVSSNAVNDLSMPLNSVVGRVSVRCLTKNEKNSWFAIHFHHCNVKVSHYTLRHYNSWDTECIRHWKFQGSHYPDTNWDTLMVHDNDTHINGKGYSYTWPVNSSHFYNKFRILQTGFNSNNHYYLCLSGFELYGEIQEEKGHDLSNIGVANLMEEYNKSTFIQYDPSKEEIFLPSSNEKIVPFTWHTIMGRKSLTHGVHFYRLHVISFGDTSNTWKIVFGIAPSNFNCNSQQNWIGSQNSMGYIAGNGMIVHNIDKINQYGAKFGVGDDITMKIDLNEHYVSYNKNGMEQGRAFSLPPNINWNVAVSLTGQNCRVRLQYTDIFK